MILLLMPLGLFDCLGNPSLIIFISQVTVDDVENNGFPVESQTSSHQTKMYTTLAYTLSHSFPEFCPKRMIVVILFG